MSERRSKSRMIRLVALLACVCGSLYYLPTLLEKLGPGRSATDALLTQYLPAASLARLQEIEASGRIVRTDKGLDVSQCYIHVRRGTTPLADQPHSEQDNHQADDDAASETRTVSGGS